MSLTDSPSTLKELVITALTAGGKDKKLCTKAVVINHHTGKKIEKHWRVQGFFAQSAISNLSGDEIHIPRDYIKDCKIKLYGCRFGSPFKIRERNCKSFKNQQEAIEEVDKLNTRKGEECIKQLSIKMEILAGSPK